MRTLTTSVIRDDMQPCHAVLRSRLVLMARWVLSLLVMVVLSVFSMAGCAMPDTACSATSVEPTDEETERSMVEPITEATETAPPSTATEFGSSGSVFDDQSSGFGVFPAFAPPIGLGGSTQECELGNDPYSTCI